MTYTRLRLAQLMIINFYQTSQYANSPGNMVTHHTSKPVLSSTPVKNWVYCSKVLLPTCPCWQPLAHLE